ncbi:Uma2 family endonuclease [Lentzea sp. CA-135723]|uniref:Uma2 family endonuclease n=1 Tax=Lentzea sp. CA-135723 TaxID=3239950 RepID=UPI003D8B4524
MCDGRGVLTVSQYAALGAAESGYRELVEGRLVQSPTASPDHNYACGNLISQLSAQLPAHLQVSYALDVDLELAPADAPGFVRRPDLVVFHRGAVADLVPASEVVLAVEVLSAHSHYTDRRCKRLDYAEAGIPFYWLVDLTAPVSLTALRLTPDRSYEEALPVVEVFEARDPFPLRLVLDQLIDRAPVRTELPTRRS